MAAGLGFKDFTTGEVLTAADVDGYLMQGVWVFASAAARDAAVTSPQEGNFAYLKDTNVTTYYTGSAWANLDTTGMTNPMTTTGDTIYSSSGSTPARLGIGSTGNVLTVAGGVPTWAAPAGAGANWSLLNSGGTTLSGSSTTISGISGADKIMVWIDTVYTNSTGNAFTMRINNDTGSNYTYGGIRILPKASYTANMFDHTQSKTATALALATFSDNASSQAMGWVLLSGCNSAGLKQYTQAVGTDRAAVSGEGATFNWFGGVYSGSSTVSSLVFITGAGTFSGGKVYVYTSA